MNVMLKTIFSVFQLCRYQLHSFSCSCLSYLRNPAKFSENSKL